MTRNAETLHRPTLESVAAVLGVSRTTVSNAYNRPDQLSPALRERVLDTARRLGYAGPDPVARSLRTGRAHTVGLLFTEQLSYAFADPAAVRTLQGVAHACEVSGAGLLLVPDVRGQRRDAAIVRNAAVDGFLAYGLRDDDPLVEAVLERRLPVVFIDHERCRPGYDWVGIDDRAAARTAARHLVDLGHRHVGVLSFRYPPDERAAEAERDHRCWVSDARLGGYAEALAAAGVDWEQVPIEARNANAPEDGARAAARLLRSDPRPTALLAESDLLALGALEAARALGLRVPEDLSVVGFDDIPAASLSSPPLTTVRQPLVDKGREAGRLLQARIAAPARPAVTLVLPAELVVRSTTAPPARTQP